MKMDHLKLELNGELWRFCEFESRDLGFSLLWKELNL